MPVVNIWTGRDCAKGGLYLRTGSESYDGEEAFWAMAGLTRRRRVTRSSSSHPRPRQERRNTIAQVQEPRHASHTVTRGLGCPGLVIPSWNPCLAWLCPCTVVYVHSRTPPGIRCASQRDNRPCHMPAHRKSIVSSRYSSYDGEIDRVFTCDDPLIAFHLIRLDREAFEDHRSALGCRVCVQDAENR